MTPEAYAELLARVAPFLKEIDPQAQVAGPAVCGIEFDWHENLFRAGGGKYLDIISIHDYEGNVSIDRDTDPGRSDSFPSAWCGTASATARSHRRRSSGG